MSNTVYLLYDLEQADCTANVTVFSTQDKAVKALLDKLFDMIQNGSEYCEDLKKAVFEVVYNQRCGKLQDIQVAEHNFWIGIREVK